MTFEEWLEEEQNIECLEELSPEEAEVLWEEWWDIYGSD